jgi:hypothetical protein
VKVKVSLCLNKYHALKTYLLLNQASHRETNWGNGYIAPSILDLGTRRRQVFGFTPRGKSSRYPLDSRQVRPQSQSGSGSEEKKFHYCPRWELKLGRPAHSLVSIVIELSQLWVPMNISQIIYGKPIVCGIRLTTSVRKVKLTNSSKERKIFVLQ